MKNKIILFFLLFILFNPFIIHAQQESVHGIVFYDENKNGIKDVNEYGIKDVYIKIYDKNGERLRNKNTSEAISYLTEDDGSFEIPFYDEIKTIKFRKPTQFESFIYDSQIVDSDEFSIDVDLVKDIKIGLYAKDYIVQNHNNRKLDNFFNKIEWAPVLTTIKTSLTAIVFTFFIGLILARIALAIKVNSIRVVIDALFTLPLVLPPTVIGFFLLKALGVNSFIGRFFINFFEFKLVFSWESTVIAAVVLSLPLMYRSTLGAIEQVDKNIVYAARTLGFSERRIFWQILVPNAIPGIASATILSFARGMGEYGATTMIAGNIIGVTRTIPIAVAVTTSAGQDEQANFYVVLILIVAMILITLMNLITLKISSKGVKS